jgi:pimeloyl-ACP methyl ester carboxylesterase
MLGDEAAFAYFQMFVPRLGRSNIGCPVRVMHAELDQIFTSREVEATARKLGVRPVSLPQTAHDIMLDPNWKFAAEDLVRWMRTLKQ